MILRTIQMLYAIALIILFLHIISGPPMGESETGLWDIMFVSSAVYCVLSGPLTWIALLFKPE